jgi:adenylylsulfate kinase
LLEVMGPERAVEILDGDEIRQVLSSELGFSRKDRDTNVQRIAYVAQLLARHGVTVLVAAVSPYREAREAARAAIEAGGVRFVEVFVAAKLATLTERDPKGLYRRALAGEICNFTGISDPYEAPLNPEVMVQTDREDVAVSLKKILAVVLPSGLASAPAAPRALNG